jgi:hypothetical protein
MISKLWVAFYWVPEKGSKRAAQDHNKHSETLSVDRGDAEGGGGAVAPTWNPVLLLENPTLEVKVEVAGYPICGSE